VRQTPGGWSTLSDVWEDESAEQRYVRFMRRTAQADDDVSQPSQARRKHYAQAAESERGSAERVRRLAEQLARDTGRSALAN
jgi:uncharacterized protein YdbL (DUF1318 family)